MDPGNVGSKPLFLFYHHIKKIEHKIHFYLSTKLIECIDRTHTIFLSYTVKFYSFNISYIKKIIRKLNKTFKLENSWFHTFIDFVTRNNSLQLS